MKTRIIALISTIAILVVLLAGCQSADNYAESGSANQDMSVAENQSADYSADSNGGNGTTPTLGAVLAAVDLDEAAPLIEPSWETDDNPAQAAARGANDFAFRLAAQLLQDVDAENFVVSPYSVWLPLAALLNATHESSSDELLAALGAAGITAEDINRAASRMLFDLTSERDREWMGEDFESPLQIANAIFVDHDVTLRRDFAQMFLDYFRGTAMNVDFSSQEAVDAVNQWAYDNTNGLITDLIEEFDQDTVAAIANAIYFSANWSSRFNSDLTESGTFYSPSGERDAYFMVLEGDGLAYFEDDNMQAIRLGVGSGGMWIMLPRDGDSTGFLRSMTSESFEALQQNATWQTGRLLLPRFSIESTIDDLISALIGIGVPESLFCEVSGPLTGVLYDTPPLFISDAVQKALVEIDEDGVRAAAVTVFAMAPTSAPIQTEPFEMICNSPFAFVLYQHTMDGGAQVLFTGVVNEP